MRVRFVDLDGVRTRYLYEGSGFPLVLIHGVGLSADTWIRNIDPLGRDFFVCAPDLPGHGFAAPVDFQGGPPQPYMVDHLAHLVEALGFDRFAVVGSSFGGLLAALLYFKMPERVTRLGIVGSGSAFNTEAELARTLPEVYKNGMSAISNPTLDACRRRLANICYSPASVPEEILLTQLTSYAMPGIVSAYERTLGGMMNLEAARPYRILERLEQISVPTLIVWGRQDIRGVYERAVEAQRRLPRGRLVTFEQCGHLPYVEYPELFNQTVREFLGAGSPVSEVP